MIGRVLREPLVHFLFIGVLLFVLSGILGGQDLERDDRIRVTSADRDRLRALWEAQYKRPPTSSELEGAVQAYIREEILNREARALGLDRDDIVIRRRLAQKVDFLTEDIASSVPPTDAEVRVYYDEHVDAYRRPAEVTFTHVYFNTDERGVEAATRAAAELRDSLNASLIPAADTQRHGDPFVLPADYEAYPQPDVERLFGRSPIVDALLGIEPGVWGGPVASSYGLHIIYVRERSPAREPDLEEVYSQVSNDLAGERRRAARENFYSELLKKYTIEIEPATASDTLAGVAGSVREEAGR